MKKWKHLPVLDFVKKAKKNVQVVWFGRYLPIKDTVSLFVLTKTLTRSRQITDWSEWRFFEDTTYCLSGDWKLNGYKKETISTHERFVNPDWFGQFDRRRSYQLITLYDTNKKKRLLIDGTKRALALTRRGSIHRAMRGRKKDKIGTTIDIWECYGSNLYPIFPCDLHQL